MNRLFLIVGASGSGKTTLARKAFKYEAVSFTTRKPRLGEVAGVDYHFVSKEHIDDLAASNLLMERVTYAGNDYGYTKEEINSKLKLGNVFAVVNIHGYEELSKAIHNSVGIFIKASKEDVEKQLKSRGDTDEQVALRLSLYDEEVKNESFFEHVVSNRNNRLEKALNELNSIIANYR